ncbi:10858_t:CDS:2 [Paraglomus occultum]|uniref:10858_t:CDS:1 n=1 Tax=Paraglomus occultum TaxID=144539 RepID=A0A9N9DN94_9GLOM|nr:10858_t:CDS:2 [Paraglomus occultum]
MSSAQSSMQLSNVSDPLRVHVPPNETPEERKRRIAAEKKAKKISEAIDKQLKAERDEMEKTRGTKLLLLGSSESGKTTVLKQLKIIHGKGLENEREQYRHIVHLNVLTAIKALAKGFEVNNLTLENSENDEHLAAILSLSSIKESLNRQSLSLQAAVGGLKSADDATAILLANYESVKAVWSDSAVQKYFESANDIGLQDSAKYFLDNVDRLAQENYLPTDEDILQARIRTLGVTEHKFDINSTTYKIYDVGGHRSQRQYWAPYFDDVNAIIFMAAVSAFDQPLEEDLRINRMRDSLDLFNTICNHPLFKNTSIILFLNKIDILKKKLNRLQLKTYFKEYQGANDFQSVTKFFRREFLSRNKVVDKNVYVHFTHATDTTQMRVIVASVNDMIQRENLKASGLI